MPVGSYWFGGLGLANRAGLSEDDAISGSIRWEGRPVLKNFMWLAEGRGQSPRPRSGAWALAWLVTLGWAAAGLGADAAMAERRVALLIGNGGYQHARVLPNPKNDAEAIAALLRQIGFAADDVILKLDLDYKAMRGEVRTFASKAASADVAVVYYAGHGIEVAGENYLVPVDAKLARDRDLEYEAVTLASVLDSVGEARKLKLVILDACRDNPLSHKIALRSGVTRKVVRGLETIEPQGDVLVAYAAKAGTVALDGAGKHSPFAEALLKHMRTPGVDVFRMFGKVTESVLDATKRQQEPWLYGRASGEAITLVPEPPRAPPKPPAMELPPPPPPVAPPRPTDGLSATDAVRICREVADISSLSVLGALAAQHKGTPARPCITARMEELTKAQAGKTRTEVEKKAESASLTAADPRLPPIALKAPDPAPPSIPATECDRLAAAPGHGPAGVTGVPHDQIDASRAIAACREAIQHYPAEGRFQAWLGRSLKKISNFGDARLALEKAAEKGEATSMTNLGWLHQNGKGVAQDFTQARLWYEKAAERGEPTGMSNLATLYSDALGVPQDYAKARLWYEKAAEKGLLPPMVSIARLYFTGKGGAQDYARARGWFEKAAEKGDAVGMRYLGIIYRDGNGIPQDYAMARSWLEKAVERGSTDAMVDLGGLYSGGLGVSQNYAIARDWYEKAVAKGNAGAMNQLGVLHHTGRGVMQSYVVARGWYEKAMAKGEAASMYNLALLYNGGLGVNRSSQSAARYLLGSSRWGNLTARRDLDAQMQPWSQDTRKAIQELLIASGDYRGSAHGIWDHASRDAAKAYYSRRS
jgi:TPR repeat protein/uncharacterized caspase-like protein